jgi:hypothetical protein
LYRALKERQRIWRASHESTNVERNTGEQKLIAADCFAVLTKTFQVKEFADIEAKERQKVAV